MTTPRFTLSPLSAALLETVRMWRNQDRIRQNMVHTHKIDPETHRAWHGGLAHDPAQRFYILDVDGRPTGSLYYSRIAGGEAEIGYYLGEERVPPGSGLVLEWLALEQGFRGLGLERLHALVKPENTAPQKLHALFRFERLADTLATTDDPGAAPLRHYFYARLNWDRQRDAVLARLPKGIRTMATCAAIHSEPTA